MIAHPPAAIDRAALIEAAAKAISTYQHVSKVLKSLRELHFAKTYTCTHLRPPGELGPCCRHEICATCNQMHPCPTVRLLDQIEADAKGDE